MSTPTINVIGLILNLVGVVVLFRYGMPFRVRTGGSSYLLLEGRDENAAKLESRYDIYGYCGLAAVVLGTAFQICGALRG